MLSSLIDKGAKANVITPTCSPVSICLVLVVLVPPSEYAVFRRTTSNADYNKIIASAENHNSYFCAIVKLTQGLTAKLLRGMRVSFLSG